MTRFRTLALLILAAVLVYTGLWYTAGMKAEKAVVAKFSAWRDAGLKVDHGKVTLEGFPYRIIITVDKPEVRTRAKGLQVKAGSLTLISHLWTPGHWMAEAHDVAASAAGDAWALTDGYMRASYRRHEDGRPIIVVDSLATDDFQLLKAPGLDAPARLDSWTLYLRPGTEKHGPDSGLYEDRFLDFKLQAAAGATQVGLEGGISGPVIADWTADQLAAWRDGGGILEFDSIDFAVAGARLKGNASLTLDETFKPLGSASLTMAGGSALARWLDGTGIQADTAIATIGEEAASVPVMLQNGQVTVGNAELTSLKPVIGD
ncbi:MAG: DUF2125 domain-containing protein [Alphaproteobacteria bacterium]|nr:MAG: DUF2125 domain-containing protein [Alphaproteobacteria bacterium]